MTTVHVTHHDTGEGHYYVNYSCGPVELLVDDEGVVELAVEGHTIPFSLDVREALQVLLANPGVVDALKSAGEEEGH